GALSAYRLSQAGKRVLVIDAGPAVPPNRGGYMETFYLAMAKTPESPYPENLSAPNPLTLDVNGGNGYFIQNGALPFASTYERVAGGTTWHWMGTSLRLLPNDFALRTNYGVGVDWPIGYDDLEPWYCEAEQEIGVAGNVADQSYLGLHFSKPYPMPGIVQSYMDQRIAARIGQMQIYGNPVTVSPTPQARNSIPFDQRRVCAGNTNCIPICPIQAKYDATIHIQKAEQLGAEVWYQTVATSVSVDPETGRITGINYKQYAQQNGPPTASGTLTASIYVLAAHAVETAKVLLNSRSATMPRGVANRSDQVGRNLMDHPIQLSWAKMPEPVYPLRGPLSTSGIESLRDGAFRSQHPAFRMEIGNEGWNWAENDPWNSLNNLVTAGTFGPALKAGVSDAITPQTRLGSLVEQLPMSTNTVTLSNQTDNLGVPRPTITYDLDDYTRSGFKAAAQASTAIFKQMGAVEATAPPSPMQPTAFEYEGELYQVRGAGHLMGTYRMGTDPTQSVVDANQRSHDHQNLYLLGSGVFPSVGTANPTLTIAALTLMAAKQMVADLG
ncbi:MAG TPA: GMC family oxidoreductase, partial [Longimicrobium sp.]|nr:GMC family oxidoreductase [Longimicrobium sp.]